MKPEDHEAVDRKRNRMRGCCNNRGEKAEPATKQWRGDENVQERGKLGKDRRSTATNRADVTKTRETWNAWKYRELAGREKEDEKNVWELLRAELFSSWSLGSSVSLLLPCFLRGGKPPNSSGCQVSGECLWRTLQMTWWPVGLWGLASWEKVSTWFLGGTAALYRKRACCSCGPCLEA